MDLSVLITSSSFLDTPGPHRDKLNEHGFQITEARGPLEEDQLLQIIESGSGFDGIICGTDAFTARVLEKCSPRTKVISRYGVGLDKVDTETAERLGIQILNTPRFNHATVAELTFGLMISISRRIPEHVNLVRDNQWTRMTGFELHNKTIAIFGFGMVGKEVAKIALSFGMNVIIHNSSWNEVHEEYFQSLGNAFANNLLWDKCNIERAENEEDVFRRADYISLHLDLNRNTLHFMNQKRLELCKPGVFIINCSRGSLVDENAIAEALRQGQIGGYATDVLEKQPIRNTNPLLTSPNVIITPHIGGRTFESVYKQGLAAVDNLVNILKLFNP